MSAKLVPLSITAILSAGLLFLESGQTGPSPADRSDLVALNQAAQAEKKEEGEPKPAGSETGGAAGGGPQKTAEFVSALVRTAREGGAQVLSEGDSYDDFPSVAQASDTAVYLAYAAYYDGHDQIRLHKRFPGGGWSTRTNVPLARGAADIWMPQLAVDAADRLWVVWCEQTGQSAERSGNWDLYARSLDGHEWGPLVRLTDDPKPDINPHVFSDAARNIEAAGGDGRRRERLVSARRGRCSRQGLDCLRQLSERRL
jgi:hypothetical protein